ncbi:MAG: winged helix-turn-helix domain-containing protein [Paracoccaceae bacterium]
MKEGPNIAEVASLIGEPARANILTALMTGKALTATELAHEAGVTAQTASSHLRKLEDAQLVTQRKEGRHRYFSLGGEDVAQALESLMGLAAGRGHLRTQTGPRDSALRHARVCYSHLAGDMGVHMFQSMQASGHFATSKNGLILSSSGTEFVSELGLNLETLPPSSAPMCRECLDWSARQSHLAGRLGRAMLAQIITLGWAKRIPDSRVVQFSKSGQLNFEDTFGCLPAPE